jgi:ElaB/YqjD/DUF883 family membrane-anchored ribosome-binding protein
MLGRPGPVGTLRFKRPLPHLNPLEEIFLMNANANNSAESIRRASEEAASDLKRRGGKVRDVAQEELRAFLGDVEELVERVRNVADDDVARVRSRVIDALGDVRRQAGDSVDSLRERARVAAGQANEYVRERPWTAIGLAAAIGLIVGVGVSAVSSRR